MSIQRDYVCVGDSDAKLHVFNPKNNCEPVKSYSTGHTSWIMNVHLTQGSLITGSPDGIVKIWSSTDPPKLLNTLASNFEEIEGVNIIHLFRKFYIERESLYHSS